MTLRDAIVLVTGASRGIGRAVALAFAHEGACVVATGRDQALLATLVPALREGHAEAWTEAIELTAADACERLVAQVLARHGRLDVLVNNAGIAAVAPVERLTLEDWRHLMAINLEVPMRLTRQAVPVMRRQNSGRIINIASDAALRGIGGMSLYCASKHALLGFARAVNEELRGTPVRITTLCPGPVTTDILGPGNPDAMAPEDVAEAAVGAVRVSDRTVLAEVLLRPTRLG
jgi:3-oxoacyl-[acyl-carrier protein] reductase